MGVITVSSPSGTAATLLLCRMLGAPWMISTVVAEGEGGGSPPAIAPSRESALVPQRTHFSGKEASDPSLTLLATDQDKPSDDS